MIDAKSVDADALFRVFTACPNDPKVLVLDVRPQKQFKRSHIIHAFCVRLSANGQALLDYSQASYDLTWSQDCWWGRPVIVYGPSGLSKDNPVISYLSKEGRCSSLGYYKEGLEAFEAKFPYLVTASVKQGCLKHFPSVIVPGLLYLGDWADASNADRLKELRVKRICTIHNHPENLTLAPGVRHLKLELPDIEGADISIHFNAAYEFIEEGRRLKEPTLVHCGAGVSRSAALVMMYLMRSRPGCNAQKALDIVKGARSLVQPNDGFWRVLCALEAGLGIPPHDRSDPNATTGFKGADAEDLPQLHENAAGEKVAVVVLDAGALSKQQQAQQRVDREWGREQGGDSGEVRRGEEEQRVRDRDRDRDRWRSRSSSRDRDRRYGRSRSRSRERERRGRRSRSRSRSREQRREGHGAGATAAAAPAPAAAVDPVAAAAAVAKAQGKKGWLLVVDVSKPEGAVGKLVLGPVGLHQRIVFGRAPPPACDVVLEHLSVSRQHAALTVDDRGGVLLTDLGSAHGTKLGDTWIKAQSPRKVAVGAVMRFGASTRMYKLERVEKVA